MADTPTSRLTPRSGIDRSALAREIESLGELPLGAFTQEELASIEGVRPDTLVPLDTLVAYEGPAPRSAALRAAFRSLLARGVLVIPSEEQMASLVPEPDAGGTDDAGGAADDLAGDTDDLGEVEPVAVATGALAAILDLRRAPETVLVAERLSPWGADRLFVYGAATEPGYWLEEAPSRSGVHAYGLRTLDRQVAALARFLGLTEARDRAAFEPPIRARMTDDRMLSGEDERVPLINGDLAAVEQWLRLYATRASSEAAAGAAVEVSFAHTAGDRTWVVANAQPDEAGAGVMVWALQAAPIQALLRGCLLVDLTALA